jgi:hypothetical protein
LVDKALCPLHPHCPSHLIRTRCKVLLKQAAKVSRPDAETSGEIVDTLRTALDRVCATENVRRNLRIDALLATPSSHLLQVAQAYLSLTHCLP